MQAQQTISGASIPSIGMDIQLSSLKSYIDEISGCLNQHASLINQFNQTLQQKLNTDQLPKVLNKLSEGTLLYDSDLSQRVYSTISKNLKQESTDISLENTLNRFINRQIVHSQAFGSLNQDIKSLAI